MLITCDGPKVIIDYKDGCGPIYYRSKIDALLEHVMRELGIERKADLMSAVSIDDGGASKVRRNKIQIPEVWFLHIHEYSGIPVHELREVACTPFIPHHDRARK